MSSVKKARNVFGLVGSVVGAVGAVSDLRKARGDRDKLALTNALANILVVVTSAALALRELRKGADDQ